MNKILKNLGKKINKEIVIPGDKSISIRALIISNIFYGDYKLINFNNCSDTKACADIFDKLCDIDIASPPANAITLNCQNSATTMRLISGVIASMYDDINIKFILTGDKSLLKRPMGRIITPLRKLGFNIQSKNKNDLAPLIIDCKNKDTILIKNRKEIEKTKTFIYNSPIASAQVKSCIELATFIKGYKLKYTELSKSRNHTKNMLSYFLNNHFHEYLILGDPSTAAFFIANAILYPDSAVCMDNICLTKERIGFFTALQKMGANLTFANIQKYQNESVGDIQIQTQKNDILKPINVNQKSISQMIDEVPLLAIIMAKADGISIINGVNELRYKESDRLKAIIDIFDLYDIKYNIIEKNNITSLKIYGDKNFIYSNDAILNNTKKLKTLKNIIKQNDHRILILLMILNLFNDYNSTYLNIAL